MMTRIAGPPGGVHIGQRVQVEMTQVADAELPCFRPLAEPAGAPEPGRPAVGER